MDNQKPRIGDGCRWGQIDRVSDLAPGIWSVSTPSHGGIKITLELLWQIPKEFRPTKYSGDGWFEEDCDWVVPYVWFADIIRDAGVAFHFERNIAMARRILKMQHLALHSYLVNNGTIPDAA